MISSVNFLNISNIKPISFKQNNVSFGARKSILDEYLQGSATTNSQKLIDALKKGKYSQAREFLMLAADDFDPNYQDKDGMSIIGAIFHPDKFLNKRQAEQYMRYRQEILLRVFDHPKFDQNKPYSCESDNVRYYIEDAVEHNDMFLATLLYKSGKGVFDPFYDDYETLSKKSKNYNMKYLLSQMPLFIIGAKALNNQEADPAYESKELKPYRAYLSDKIPFNLDEVGGMKEAKGAINDFILTPWSEPIRGQLKDNNIDMPNGFLMYGPPGCGKTYIAKVIAKQSGFPLYEVDLSSIGTSAAYKTANTLKEIFKALEEQYAKTNTPSILFLDEIDSIAASREKSHTDWKRDEVNTLITLMNNASEKGIIVVGATNLLNNVDQAILRPGRFDKKIKIELPDKEERKDIIEKITLRKKIAVDLYDMADEIAEITSGKSPSELNAIINDCCRRAIYKNKSRILMDDFKASMQKIESEKEEGEKKVIRGFSER